MTKHVDSHAIVARAPLLALVLLPFVASTAYAQQQQQGGQSVVDKVGQSLKDKVAVIAGDDPLKTQSDAPADSGLGLLGLSPGTPAVATLPGGPAYGTKPKDEQDQVFDFHGFLTMPFRVGLNTRAGVVTTQQHNVVIHAPPVVPDYPDSPNYTSVVPQPYAQLAFSYGNSIVTGTAIIKAWTATTAESFFDPSLQGGITDAFITFNLPKLVKNAHLEINVGAFSNRYGTMGEYDAGHYGTPIIGQTNGVGENIIGRMAFGDVALTLEQGFQAQLDAPPVGLTTDGSDGFANPNAGTGLVEHEHLGFTYRRQLTVGLHHMLAWSQDDRADQALTPDGSIHVFGADVRFSASHLGHAYIGGSYTIANNAATLGRILSIMNTQGGLDLMRDYLGPNSAGNGKIITVGGEYNLSLSRLLFYPRDYDGMSRDVVLSVFGILTHVSSADPLYNANHMLKVGAEGTYTLLSWLAASARLDYVSPTSNVPGRGSGSSRRDSSSAPAGRRAIRSCSSTRFHVRLEPDRSERLSGGRRPHAQARQGHALALREHVVVTPRVGSPPPTQSLARPKPARGAPDHLVERVLAGRTLDSSQNHDAAEALGVLREILHRRHPGVVDGGPLHLRLVLAPGGGVRRR